MTKTEASNFTRVIAAKLNERPYGLRFANTDATGPLHPGQDLQMEAICPNHWKISHRVKGITAAFVHLPAALTEHQAEVQDQLELLATFHDQKILPSLILDTDRKRLVTDPPLRVNSLVMFWMDGDNSKLRELSTHSQIQMTMQGRLKYPMPMPTNLK